MKQNEHIGLTHTKLADMYSSMAMQRSLAWRANEMNIRQEQPLHGSGGTSATRLDRGPRALLDGATFIAMPGSAAELVLEGVEEW